MKTKMSDTPKPKKKRARGKRVGPKILEETYEPLAIKAFDGVLEMAKKRLKLRRGSVSGHVEEELEFKDVRDRLARIINVAYDKKERAKSLLKEAGQHRRKAVAIAQLLQIMPIDQSPHDQEELEPNPTSHESFGIKQGSYNDYANGGEDDWSQDLTKTLDATMWLHKEHLDVLEVEHWRTHFHTEIQKCITMEDCVEMIDNATAKAAELAAAIQEGDGDVNNNKADGAEQSE
jgi:hypothetical protein